MNILKKAHSLTIGSVYPIQMYILKTHIPQPCAQRAHRHPPNYIYHIYIYPCWQNIIPQFLAAYIQYQYINSNGKYSPIVCSIYPIKCIFPRPAPEDRSDTPKPGCYKLRNRATDFVVKSVLSQFMRFWVYQGLSTLAQDS